MIEMPLVNYPPSFYHPYVSCTYTLFASLERPGERPFQTQHMTLDFQPIVSLTSSGLTNSLHTCPIHQKIPLPAPAFSISVVIPQQSFTVHQTPHIPVRLAMPAAAAAAWQTQLPITVRAKLQRLVKITHTTIYQEDSTTIGRLEKTWTPSTQGPILDLQLPLPRRHPSDSSNTPLHPTMEFSKKFRIQYYVVLSVKLRPTARLSSSTKHAITIPIHLATLDQGTKTPAALVPFTHPEVLADDSMLSKPRFLPPPTSHANYLPAYDPHDNPPAYVLV